MSIKHMAKKAKAAGVQLAAVDGIMKNKALAAIAQALIHNREKITSD